MSNCKGLKGHRSEIGQSHLSGPVGSHWRILFVCWKLIQWHYIYCLRAVMHFQNTV